jgi:mannosyltransferase
VGLTHDGYSRASVTSTLQAEPTLLGETRRLLDEARSGQLRARVFVALGALLTVAGVALRFYAPSALWLDETISVNISRLSVTHIPGALAHDGAPPLYYLVLHVWMLVFGQGDVSVRALSGVVSVVTIPLFWSAGRRLGGTAVAWAALFLGITSPFAIQYATATRMYSFMILWSLLGFLAVARSIEAPTRRNLLAVGAVTAALLYTHYWSVYLVGVVGLWLLWRIWKDSRGRPIGVSEAGIRPVFGAVVLGVVVWLPWSPVFVYQTLHTGTPWTGSAGPADLLGVFGDFGGSGPWGLLLAYGLFALAALGVFGRPASPDTAGGRTAVLLTTRPNRRVAGLIGVVAGTLVVAVAAGSIAQAAFVARYAAVVLPLFLLVVAAGVGLFPRRVAATVLVVLSVAGVLTGFGQNSKPLTQAVQVASVLNVQAQPGDLVVYCPDQLGPAVDRLLAVPGISELTFPRAIGPQRVDWVDYKATIAAAHVDVFAQQMLSRLGANHTLWLVYRDGYPGLGGSCGQLRSWLDLLRPTGETAVHANGGKYYEYENLVRYPN